MSRSSANGVFSTMLEPDSAPLTARIAVAVTQACSTSGILPTTSCSVVVPAAELHARGRRQQKAQSAWPSARARRPDSSSTTSEHTSGATSARETSLAMSLSLLSGKSCVVLSYIPSRSELSSSM
eukprot:scaffold259_cov252-Pinguiococcus_pyrenoidosus.AAC.11